MSPNRQSFHGSDLQSVALAEEISMQVHASFHWQAIRTVCRNRKLRPEVRREKLRFLVAGLRRSRV